MRKIHQREWAVGHAYITPVIWWPSTAGRYAMGIMSRTPAAALVLAFWRLDTIRLARLGCQGPAAGLRWLETGQGQRSSLSGSPQRGGKGERLSSLGSRNTWEASQESVSCILETHLLGRVDQRGRRRSDHRGCCLHVTTASRIRSATHKATGLDSDTLLTFASFVLFESAPLTVEASVRLACVRRGYSTASRRGPQDKIWFPEGREREGAPPRAILERAGSIPRLRRTPHLSGTGLV